MIRTFISTFDLKELLRFAVVGSLSGGVYLVVLYLLLPVAALWVSTTLAYCVAMAVNYLAQRAWTFKSERAHRQALPRYVTTHGGAIVINTVTMEVFFASMGYPLLPVQLMAFVAICTWSYILQKFWVFQHDTQ